MTAVICPGRPECVGPNPGPVPPWFICDIPLAPFQEESTVRVAPPLPSKDGRITRSEVPFRDYTRASRRESPCGRRRLACTGVEHGTQLVDEAVHRPLPISRRAAG